MTPQLGFGFRFDRRVTDWLEQPDPSLPWESPLLLEAPGPYTFRPILSLKTGTLAPVRITAWGERPPALPCSATVPGEEAGLFLVLDLGRETAGFFEMELETPAPCLMEVGYGEHLEDLRVRTVIGSRRFAFSYQARQGCQRFLYPIK